MANCMTLVRMVMAPTAMSPPYLSKEELKQMEMTLSLACIMKVDRPSARLGRIIFASSRRFFNRIFSKVFLPNRKDSTQMQDIAWQRMVASAAPRTPM